MSAAFFAGLNAALDQADECFDWRQAEGGIAAFAKYFETVAGGAG